MNENMKFLLAEDKFVPEIHLRQPGFTQKTKKIKKFKEKTDTYITDRFIKQTRQSLI